MIRVNVSLADATVTETETLTAGRVGLECGFTFSSEWDGLMKVAVFEGAETIEVALGKASVAVVPPECMATAGYNLRVGVYGLSPANAIVIPTVWAKAGKIKDSAAPDEESFAPATPELVAQIIAASETALDIAQGVAEQAESGAFDGADGFSPSASVVKSGNEASIMITDKNGSTEATVYDGDDGNDATVAVGTTTTLSPGSDATVTNSGTPGAAVFNFGIPKGDKGDTGDSGVYVGTSAPTDPDVDVWIDPSGGASNEPFVVTLTPTALDYSGTMDKTVAEIYAAYQAGKKIVFRLATAADTHIDVDVTLVGSGDDYDYPSFEGYVINSTNNVLIWAGTGVTDDDTKATYSTVIYTLTPAT